MENDAARQNANLLVANQAFQSQYVNSLLRDEKTVYGIQLTSPKVKHLILTGTLLKHFDA